MGPIEPLDPDLMTQRFALIQQRYWPLDEAIAHYGYNPDVLHAWGVLGADGRVDRHGLEFQAMKRRWLSVRLAAAELSMTEASVKGLLKLAGQTPSLSALLPEHSEGLTGGMSVVGGAFDTPAWMLKYPEPTPLLRGGELLEDWIVQTIREGEGRFAAGWSTLSQRANLLHTALNQALEAAGQELRIEPLLDEVARRYQHLAPDLFRGVEYVPEASEPERFRKVVLAREWCALSRAPVAVQHTAVLWPAEGRKPIALSPDRVGWHVMLACPEIEMHVLGGQGAFERLQERVRGADAHA